MRMGQATLEKTVDGWQLRVAGDWRLADLARLDGVLDALRPVSIQAVRVNGAELTSLDSAGAMLLHGRLGRWGLAPEAVAWTGFSAHHAAMIELTRPSLFPETRAADTESWLHRLGRRGETVLRQFADIAGFIGEMGVALVDWFRRPGRIRWREIFVQFEAVGITGLPIVALMTFLIGVVFTYLLGVQIEKYGANIFIVDGVSLAVTRELAPLLTALLVAGRSGAAFTAQIGAMKVTEEIDAIRTLGLSPMQVLVLPRLVAIVVSLPLLAFFADVMGILGAAVVSARQLDITAYTFFARLQDVLPLYTVMLGLAKTPVFAVAIAVIACRNGFTVTRDARSIGEHTTTTVVHCLVAVILIDALFSIAFPKIKP